MSDKNNIFGSDYELESIIAAAMEKKKQRAVAASAELEDKPSDKAVKEKAAEEKPAPSEKPSEPKPEKPDKPAEEKPAREARERLDKEPAVKKPAAEKTASKPHEKPAEPSAEKKPAGEKAEKAGELTLPDKKPQKKAAAGSGTAQKKNNPHSNEPRKAKQTKGKSFDDDDGENIEDAISAAIARKKGTAAANGKTASGKSAASKAGGKNGKGGKKKKFTKKQTALFIGGVVFLSICLLALIIFLIFHFYFGKLAGEDSRADPTAPMSYADTDPNMSDTFDPEEEERRLKEQLEQNATDIMSDKDVFNVLLVGEDLRSGSAEVRGNTDVMMLISLNKKLGTITMTSFMRDLYLYIPDINASDRLNAAYYLSGTETLKNTIQQYFAVSIDRYVIVNFNQFIKIVDTLGGLDIEITDDEAHGYEYERDNIYAENNRGMENPLDEQNYILGNPHGTDYLPELSKDGEVVHCNGNQALAYARLRYVGKGDKDSDFGRTQRQREVISLMIDKAKHASLVQLKELADEILPDTYTDLQEGETASLLLHAFEYMSYSIQPVQIPADGTWSGHYVDHKAVLLADLRENARILQQTIYGSTKIAEEQNTDDSLDSNDSDQTSSNPYDHNGYYDDSGNWIDYEDQYRYATSSNYNYFS